MLGRLGIGRKVDGVELDLECSIEYIVSSQIS